MSITNQRSLQVSHGQQVSNLQSYQIWASRYWLAQSQTSASPHGKFQLRFPPWANTSLLYTQPHLCLQLTPSSQGHPLQTRIQPASLPTSKTSSSPVDFISQKSLNGCLLVSPLLPTVTQELPTSDVFYHRALLLGLSVSCFDLLECNFPLAKELSLQNMLFFFPLCYDGSLLPTHNSSQTWMCPRINREISLCNYSWTKIPDVGPGQSVFLTSSPDGSFLAAWFYLGD